MSCTLHCVRRTVFSHARLVLCDKVRATDSQAMQKRCLIAVTLTYRDSFAIVHFQSQSQAITT
jgi:hypothetical protein